mmetsp:Transcript_47919/g.83930  ORF Transcript_47919/g.83930 Transcript_47919/m.83930 type:complete len:203 (-) Transcript_47919:99-707(-)
MEIQQIGAQSEKILHRLVRNKFRFLRLFLFCLRFLAVAGRVLVGIVLDVISDKIGLLGAKTILSGLEIRGILSGHTTSNGITGAESVSKPVSPSPCCRAIPVGNRSGGIRTVAPLIEPFMIGVAVVIIVPRRRIAICTVVSTGGGRGGYFGAIEVAAAAPVGTAVVGIAILSGVGSAEAAFCGGIIRIRRVITPIPPTPRAA